MKKCINSLLQTVSVYTTGPAAAPMSHLLHCAVIHVNFTPQQAELQTNQCAHLTCTPGVDVTGFAFKW